MFTCRPELIPVRLNAGSDMKRSVKVYDRRLSGVFDRLIRSRYNMCRIVVYVRTASTPASATAPSTAATRQYQRKREKNGECLLSETIFIFDLISSYDRGVNFEPSYYRVPPNPADISLLSTTPPMPSCRAPSLCPVLSVGRNREAQRMGTATVLIFSRRRRREFSPPDHRESLPPPRGSGRKILRSLFRPRR